MVVSPINFPYSLILGLVIFVVLWILYEFVIRRLVERVMLKL